MVTPSTMTTLRPASRTPTTLLKLQDQLLLLLKRQLMAGERDPLQTLDQYFHCNKNKTQMILTLMPQDLEIKPTLLRKDKTNTMPESYGETNKRKNTMPGEEFHGLQQRRISVLSHFLKKEPSLMDITSTMTTSRQASRTLMMLLKLLDLQLLLLKKPPMLGERDQPQTL